jgi:hypothetical protein
MGAIDVGSGAIKRANSDNFAGYTIIDRNNPANDSGILDTVELYFDVNGTEVKVGTFSGSALSWDDRDYATIGAVTADSKQTFSGLSIDIVTDDLIGTYASVGRIDMTSNGGLGHINRSGDTFGGGANTYIVVDANSLISIYATGLTSGWAGKIQGVTAPGKVQGVAADGIIKVIGVA